MLKLLFLPRFLFWMSADLSPFPLAKILNIICLTKPDNYKISFHLQDLISIVHIRKSKPREVD